MAAKWFLADEPPSAARELLDRVLDEGACVPALFRWEIARVLLGAERAGRLTSDEVDEALDRLRDIPLRLEATGERVFPGHEVRLARYYDLTPYDAAYLSLAVDHGISIATADSALARAARDLGLSVIHG